MAAAVGRASNSKQQNNSQHTLRSSWWNLWVSGWAGVRVHWNEWECGVGAQGKQHRQQQSTHCQLQSVAVESGPLTEC